MGKIVYKPHCSKCGALIEGRPAWNKIIVDAGSNNLLKQESAEIHPCRCENCGEFFDCIEFTPPEELPTEYL